MMKKYALLVLFFFFSVAASSYKLPSQNDTETMMNLANHLPTFDTVGKWDTAGQNPCRWPGVACSSKPYPHVTQLSLSGLGLYTSTDDSFTADRFFSLLCRLSFLQSLDLSSNHFSFIPTFFLSNCTGLSQLKSLSLSSNGLGVSLGKTWSFTALEYLDLSDNELDGNVPTQLLNCRNLMVLDLSSNRLHGQLPRELGNLGHLVQMHLHDNNFSGEIPDEFSKLVNLTTLNLGQNYLSGAVPPAIFSLRSIEYLNLEDNELTGPITILDSTDASLTEFKIGSNKLNGTIPSQLGNLSQLSVLDLSNNELAGEVPSSLAQLQGLRLLVLSDNQLSGTLLQFESWVAVNITGNKDLLEMNMRTIGKFDVLIMISTFVSGFVASFSLASLVHQVSACRRENNQTGRSTPRPEPLSSVDELRRIRQLIDAANRR